MFICSITQSGLTNSPLPPCGTAHRTWDALAPAAVTKQRRQGGFNDAHLLFAKPKIRGGGSVSGEGCVLGLQMVLWAHTACPLCN